MSHERLRKLATARLRTDLLTILYLTIFDRSSVTLLYCQASSFRRPSSSSYILSTILGNEGTMVEATLNHTLCQASRDLKGYSFQKDAKL